MLRSQIHEYGHGGNGHRMFIMIEHRNLKIQKTRNDFLFGYETFLLTLS